ncbi:inositol monophosphatase family protein [Rhizobium paknamense]|nr:inositol monophosphatase family protein [Rhizobium paknamense]
MSYAPALSRLFPEASDGLVAMAEAALCAGELARTALKRRHAASIVHKAPRDYQTEIDVAVEALIVERMRLAFPDHAIAGEEGVGNRAAEGQPVIVIDPIDGTTNYAWGLPHFGIVIAIADQGEIISGIVYDCMQDELFCAEKGKGAWLNGERLHLTPLPGEKLQENALIGASLPVPGQVQSVSEEVYYAALRRLMATTAGVRRLGSAALSTAYVACGRLDGFFEDGLSLHDYGASLLMVREAGGLVTGFNGKEIGAHGDVLAAHPDLHGWLVEGFTARALS